MKETRRLIVVLGDQLTPTLASLRGAEKARDIVVMGEVAAETTYVKHHRKKIAFVFSAMRHFAEELRADGWTVDYAALDGETRFSCFTDLVADAVSRRRPAEIVVVEPGEWRVLEEIEGWSARFGLPLDVMADDRFICSRTRFDSWAAGRKGLRMEYFYRDMRRQTGLLMEGDEPVGGRWNFDAENRKPAGKDASFDGPMRFAPDAITGRALALVDREFAGHFGRLDNFWFAVTRADAEKARRRFIEASLPQFGDYQDAMLASDRYLAHSVLSLYINVGLLDPLETCRMAEKAYTDGHAPLNAVEGFIRQVVGWREFIRGVYWREGPDYTSRNFFGNARRLPEFYWTADTDMACIRAAVTQTHDEAYAHHIQRLMVTGNFALIAGVDPSEVHEWYLAVYADAYEWVEAPNTIGMSQFADGGVVASKPYAASGAYINRMSDYCKGCRYNVSKKVEADACPFNALYWDFLIRNEEKLEGAGRLARVYQNWARMDASTKKAYRAKAAALLRKLDSGERL